MVEYFLTENLLAHFNKILLQRSNRSGNVAIQMLQTLSILIQNVRNEQTVYYLFSNNHINEIVSMRFDFEDDEVLVSAARPAPGGGREALWPRHTAAMMEPEAGPRASPPSACPRATTSTS